ncbi:MAG: molybdopterin-dependent oxidoreductase [Magnetococcus sp. WYHC-3]
MSITRHPTTCPLDCPGACALIASCDPQGRLLELRGDPQHPFTRGVICGKVARYAHIQEGPRVLQPLKRQGPKGLGDFAPVSWEEALDDIAARLQTLAATHGPETIFPYYYGGTMGVLSRRLLERLTLAAGWSREDRTLCFPIGAAGWQAGTGGLCGPDPLEAEHSDFLVLWGLNAAATHINFMDLAMRAQKRGAQLVVVDPYRTETARKADWHVNPRPGTDGALAVAMMAVLLEEGLAQRQELARYTDFDAEVEAHVLARGPAWAAPITGLEAADIRAFARAYGKARAPFIRLGLGMSRQNNGAVNVHAVSCLPAVVGAWAKPGGGALFATSGWSRLNDSALGVPVTPAPPARTLDMSRLGRLLLDGDLAPPIHALLVFSANPAVTAPDSNAVWRGLAREDLLLVVHEQVMTDTARMADYVLPAATFLEQEELYKSYGQCTLQHAQAVLPPRGEARSNAQVAQALAARLSITDPVLAGNASQAIAHALEQSQLPPPGQWPSGRWLDFSPDSPTGRARHGFWHDDGRFHFRPRWTHASMPALPDHWPVNRRDLPEAQDYPLDFMTPPDKRVLNSTFAYDTAIADRRNAPVLWIHPQDAMARGVAAGDWVVVHNDRGHLLLQAHLTNDVREGLCLCESSWAAAAFPEGLPLNALTHDDRVAPDGGVAFHDNRVQVTRVD